MRYSLKKITPPNGYPLDRDDVFNMLKLDPSNPALAREAQYIEDLIASAVGKLEDYCARAFMTQTYDMVLVPNLETVPNVAGKVYGYQVLPMVIKIWRPPCQSVLSVVCVDQMGVEHVQNAVNYSVNYDVEPAELQLVYGGYWEWWVSGYYKIRFTAGYGDNLSDVPPELRNGLRMCVAEWYAGRENLDYSIPPTAIDAVSDFIISPGDL